MNTSQSCQKCGSQLSRSTPRTVCARCMLEAGLFEELDSLNDQAFPLSAAAESPSSPGRFGHYELLDELGRGGMGVVYRARDLRANRVVALKLMLAGQFATGSEMKRFRIEAEAAARLDHPNIVPIYEVGEQDGRPFYSMKLMEGSLTEQLVAAAAQRASGCSMALDCRGAANLLVKIARAVHHAHQHAILHRDLKPGNILLDARGEPHVSDFGLAKLLDDDAGLTLSGAMLGSPSYMSPEQAAGQLSALTTASDTHSLGALLYQLLTGSPPFEANTALATMEKVLRNEPVPVRALNPSIDVDLETICLKCLDKDPQRRYASADALAEDLERWLLNQPIRARPVGAVERLSKWTRRHPGTAALLLISCLATLAFLVGQTITSVRLARANRDVRASNERLSHSLYESRWRQADDAARMEERSEAIAWLSHLVRQNPHDAAAAARLLSLLSAHNFPILLQRPWVLEGPVNTLDFGQTGERLATLSSRKAARVWNVQSGQIDFELSHPTRLSHCVLAGDRDRRLLIMSAESARLWDLGSRLMLKEISLAPLDERIGRSISHTPDRRLMAINVQSNVIRVLDIESGEWLALPLSLPAEVHLFNLSEDGRMLAIGLRTEVQLWDTRNNQPLRAPVALNQAALSLRFSEDGRWLACVTRKRAWVIDTVTLAREREFQVESASIVFVGNAGSLVTGVYGDVAPKVFDFHTGKDRGSPFGQQQFDSLWQSSLAAVRFSEKGGDRTTLLDSASGRPQLEPFFHDSRIVSHALHPAGKLVATASQDRTVRMWSVEMGKAAPITLQMAGAVWEAQWSPAGDRILATCTTETGAAELQLWDARTGAVLLPPVKGEKMFFFARWAPDGSRIATAAQDATARIWSAETGEPISLPLLHGGALYYCTFSPDGAVLATSSIDRTVRLWDGRTGKAIGEPLSQSHHPLKLNFSSNGRRLASACNDGTIRVWSVPEGKLVLGPLQHEGTCWVAAFSPDDRLLVSASSDGTARLWDAITGQPALAPIRHEGPVSWAAFSPDGRAIATSTDSGIVRVWETATGELLSLPMRHPRAVSLVNWSPDGNFLATTCTDGAARVWSARTGQLVAEPFLHQKEVRRAEFSPDGQRLLTASFDGTIKIWELAFLRPALPVPDWLPDLAESLAGKRISSRDALETVPGDSFHRAKQRIEQAPAQNAYYARWVKWMFQERLERPVKPFQP